MPVVPLPIARACWQQYDELMRGDDLPKMHQAFTDTITFNTRDLANWLKTNNYLENTDSIRICLGIYTPEAASHLNQQNDEGRVTVFICPMRDGAEIDCFNGGNNGP